ncbi:YkgJ family cysteine cluster protein [Varunaivibrio sulfuroxidans]|uniref:Fe-S-cluster containining protein n=1 Tax=Varunaivibrio sulfuroxidans TaxID=1773489 RepID=A0A4R3JA90_9PROT|nr:YkgJ family cysteine cluster protein [Varunaivibrio sulfuroxidans]TCS62457.1 Fe-S-cluster containining protein [Varunaivibrio sulfuroxidans]WES30867.1 YkgJ family cysteine cluster protein [Varunaivibrio sulfuroxidans]
MERRFECTACGKCCYGWLPLSIDDALGHADRFPLFLQWTPVRQGGKSYDLAVELGLTIKLKNRKRAAVRIEPISYVPPDMPCPALRKDGLCAVHDAKPRRCRAMPLSGGRAENDQDDLLIPKADWACNTTSTAPVVYRDKKIVTREAFELERKQLMADADVLKPFAELMLDSIPSLRLDLTKLAQRPHGGCMILSFSTLVPRLAYVDIYALAAKQLPVMASFAKLTSETPKHADEHRRYTASAGEWRRILDGAP